MHDELSLYEPNLLESLRELEALKRLKERHDLNLPCADIGSVIIIWNIKGC